MCEYFTVFLSNSLTDVKFGFYMNHYSTEEPTFFP